MFENCSCVVENFYQDSKNTVANHKDVSLEEYTGNGTATDGKCKLSCNKLGLFLLSIGILVFLIFVLKIPVVLITIRYDMHGSYMQ